MNQEWVYGKNGVFDQLREKDVLMFPSDNSVMRVRK